VEYTSPEPVAFNFVTKTLAGPLILVWKAPEVVGKELDVVLAVT
jgi:hypothetical protein